MEKIGNVKDAPSVEAAILGVDTHLELHVAVALDQLGRRLGEITVPTSTRGYARLLRWAEGFGTVGCVGIEGTSSYGVGLARYLHSAEIPVVEVERPKRHHLRRNGKSDSIDAEAAARAVLAGEAAGEPKSGDGQVGMIRALLVTAPEELRHSLRKLPTKALVTTCARFRPIKEPDNVRTATKIALRSVARRHEALSEEIAKLDERLDRLVARTSPGLISLPAIGTHHAATLLCVAGDNPRRLASEASFASLCGGSPIEASSGKV